MYVDGVYRYPLDHLLPGRARPIQLWIDQCSSDVTATLIAYGIRAR